ncbi:energy-dependent translational throttle protein EttA [Engelhardtia mirabilis]|uniref:Energy-dependent translational throttle protein EttA n=1 Tax=Engelhardtia mirabilis TaxID=2528011 RepID=A0A518BJG1_9BACT|nr:putative ABC transporter ATP-binding protein [Planctomycetes bacterium Pla133]QDV01443.1 putative ABC transporter ATP-binding protein [Planctomycetes bacterium Pla86]
MSERIIYNIQELKKFYGQKEVLKGISLSFFDDAKIGVIGPNGAGKSTLLRIIAGEDKEFEGVAKPAAGATIGYLSQEPPLDESKDVAGNLEEAVAHVRVLTDRYNEVAEKMGTVTDDDELMALSDEMVKLDEQILHRDAWNLDSRLEQAATALCLPPMDADVSKLSGGERRRVALCMLLLEQPDILLLDEPTNHLDAETIEWLEEHLKTYPGCVMLITHDRYFLDNVVGWMLEVERGHGTPYKGNYSDYLDAKAKRLSEKRQGDSKLLKLIKAEREWKAKTPKARTTQSKSRLQRLKDLEGQRVEDQVEAVDLRIPPGPRLGDKVIEVEHLTKGFGGRTLIKDLTFSMPGGAILGVVGANGMGKSTLLKIMLGKEEPDEGKVTMGSTVQLTYLDQSRMILDDEKTVFDNITEGNERIPFGNSSIDGRAYVARFNFKGEDQQKLLGECSGGMRNRVLLARMLKNGANVILLDEPTNDLDLDTLRVLEEAIEHFPGSAIVVSHDRYFLNRIVTHILAFEGDGYVNFHHGTYEDYTEWRKEWRERMGFGPESRAGRYRKLLRS